MLPQLTPATELGAVFVAAYAARQGAAAAARTRPGQALTPEQAGQAITDLVTSPGRDQDRLPAHRRGPSPAAMTTARSQPPEQQR